MPAYQSDEALSVLFEIDGRCRSGRDRRRTAGLVLDMCRSALSTTKGLVGIWTDDAAGLSVLAARGMEAAEFDARHGAAARDYARGPAPALLCRDGSARPAFEEGTPESPPPGNAAAFCLAPVPSSGPERPFIAVDRIFNGPADCGRDLKYLSAAAALMSPLFRGAGSGAEEPGGSMAGRSLGKTLHGEIAAWIEPMQHSSRLRSDIYLRLMGEVEKIIIAAALEKTGFVQTEAAHFLGINRNTLGKKARQYNLTRRGRRE